MTFRLQATEVDDQFMFGPSIMVSPVLTAMVQSRLVYLPQLSGGRGWIDFWTGVSHPAGQSVSFDAPLEHLPLAVPQGSLVVMGPFLQYTSEKPLNPLEVRVYPGGDSWYVSHCRTL